LDALEANTLQTGHAVLHQGEWYNRE
jgi:hypothetical protein